MSTIRCRSFALACTGLLLAINALAVGAATFNYHGNLRDAGRPAEGKYDLELTLYSAASGGKAIAGPLALYGVSVQGGAFSAQADFGPVANVAGTAWLGVKVRSASSGEFSELSARAPVSADATESVCPGAWTLSGNAGNGPGNYLGTADAQPLILRTAGQIAVAIGIPTSSNYESASGTSIVAGYSNNGPANGAVAVTIAGGGGVFQSIDMPNTAGADFATVGGGLGNTAAGAASAIAGGDGNAANGNESSIAGGFLNLATGTFSSIGGGFTNITDGNYSTTSGGFHNQPQGDYATIAGGNANIASGGGSFVGGGTSDQAVGGGSAVAGGQSNIASGVLSFVGGGENNAASGFEASIAGGHSNSAGGDFSFAGGNGAKVRNPGEAGNAVTCTTNVNCGDFGSFVWSDGSTALTTAGSQQFLIGAQGGVGINVAPPTSTVEMTIAPAPGGNDAANLFLRQRAPNSAGIMLRSSGATSTANNDAVFAMLHYNGATESQVMQIDGAGVFQVYNATAIKPTGGSWSAPSDARLKRDVQPLANTLDRILQLRGVTFEYSSPDAYLHPAGRHTGFIAQEVQQVFPDWVGSTPDGYLTVGPNGFEAMAVEALRDLRVEKDAEVSALQNALETARAGNAAMQSALDDLTVRMARLEAAREH